MKPGSTKYVWAGLGMIPLCFLAWIALEKRSLDLYRGFIESRYKPQLSLIEREMQSGREPDYTADVEDRLAYMEARDQVRTRIGDTLSGAEIFTASWSSDGHHGLEGLKKMPTSYTHIRLLASKTPGGSRALYYGMAEDGTFLLVYQGWINSPWKREYEIVFRRSIVHRLMKSK